MGWRWRQYLCVSMTMEAGMVLVVRVLAVTVVVEVVAAGIQGREGVAVFVCQQDNDGGEGAGSEGVSGYSGGGGCGSRNSWE
jgi:hypothetical protein